MKTVTDRLDALASELEKQRPELALAIDLISDKLEKMASDSHMSAKAIKRALGRLKK